MTATVSSVPFRYSSTSARSSYRSASSSAGASSSARRTMDAPTLEPDATGFTNAGRPTPRARSRSAPLLPRTTSPRGTSRPAALSSVFVMTLSIAIADDFTPEPVYGTPSVSRSPWMRPSSPQVPCSAIRTTSNGSALSAIARVAGTSAFDAVAISCSSPFGSSRSGSRRAPPFKSSRACARWASVMVGLRTMNASGSRSTTSYLSAGSSRAICAPVASEMSRSADAPPVRTPTRIFFMGCAPPAPRLASGSCRASGIVLLAASPTPAARHVRPCGAPACAGPSGSRIGGRLPCARHPLAQTPRRASPLTHQLDFGHELDAELLANGVLAERHERSYVVGRRVADIDDEVRVLGAHHRAALGGTFETSRFDEPSGVIAGRVAKDRAGVRLRQRLLGHALVRDLLDPSHRARSVAGCAAEPGAKHDGRRLLERRRAVREAELGVRRDPDPAVEIHELRVEQHVLRLATESAGVPVHGAADGARHRRHPFEAEDPAARRDRRDARHRCPARRGDRRPIDGRLGPVVLQHDAAHARVGHEEVRAAAEHEHRELVLARDRDRAREVAPGK